MCKLPEIITLEEAQVSMYATCEHMNTLCSKVPTNLCSVSFKTVQYFCDDTTKDAISISAFVHVSTYTREFCFQSDMTDILL